ncbi:hypothetical protein DFH07DRAFT_578926 [Mycena maculata]|uniref:CCHC-type domain-containing protein n=1 Tax=Mycena maculata TaxID=230809 RepID=A0AAD7INM1_9AGAR|nr:hypothetical protein DFH07DRAFT_578926 [Mycena maculata]
MSGARGCFNCGGFGHQAAACPKAGTPTWCVAVPPAFSQLPAGAEEASTVAITAASRVMCRATARWRRSPRRATSVGRKAISCVAFLSIGEGVWAGACLGARALAVMLGMVSPFPVGRRQCRHPTCVIVHARAMDIYRWRRGHPALHQVSVRWRLFPRASSEARPFFTN